MVSDEILYVRLMVVALGTYPVEKFTTGAQVEAKIQVIACLPFLVRTSLANSM